MRETETDFKLADDYQTDFEYHKEDAISEMYEHAQCIAQGVQHHINNNCLTVEMDNIDAVHTAIQQLKDLAYYTYTGDREGRFNSQYSDTFEYNLKSEVVDLLADELGYIWENQ